jgi:formamidopyrimidine-DNA glycosylase
MRLTDANKQTIYLLNTFGMTGRWSFQNDSTARIKFVIKSNTSTNKRYTLYFLDQRNFGTIEFTSSNASLNSKLSKLAPDVLKTDMTDMDLVKMINVYIDKHINKKKSLNLVKTLMDQEAIVSGIGNYLVAEILYDAKLNPHRDLSDLSTNEKKQLAHSIRKITKYAYYDNTSGYMEHFKTFMKTHAERIDSGVFPNYHSDIKPIKNFKFKVYQQTTDPEGHKVQNDEIIKGRTIHWVKEIQK